MKCFSCFFAFIFMFCSESTNAEAWFTVHVEPKCVGGQEPSVLQLTLMEHDESNAHDVEDEKRCEKGCTLRTNDNDDAGPRMEFFLKAAFRCLPWQHPVEHCFHFDYTYQNVDYTSIVELHLSQTHKSGDWWKSDNVKIYGVYWC